MKRREEHMTMSCQEEKEEESRQRIKISFSSKERGRRYLKHVDEGETEFIEAASNKDEVKSSSSVRKQMQKETTSCPKERKEVTRQQQDTQRRIEDGATRKSSSSTSLLPEKGETKRKEIAFTVLQKTPDQRVEVKDSKSCSRKCSVQCFM